MIISVYQFHIAMSQAITHPVNCKNPVHQGSRGANGNQAVHIGGQMENGLVTFCIVFPVYNNNWNTKQKLCKSKAHRILHSIQEGWQRQPDHVSHADIHQRNEKNKRNDQSHFHVFHLLLHRVLSRCSGSGICCQTAAGIRISGIRYLGTRPVSGSYHGIYNLFLTKCVLIVFHLHAVGQKIHTHLFHTSKLRNAFLHPGRACRAGHSRHIKFFFFHNVLIS